MIMLSMAYFIILPAIFSVDENGFNHVDALEGQIGFTKYGKVQVGEVTMSAWFGIEDTTEAVLYHYSDSQTELTPYPMKESINPDGTISPFMIHAKYAAGDIDGVPYSSKGLAPANGCQATQARNPVSYTGMIPICTSWAVTIAARQAGICSIDSS